jgi:UDP-N-acetylmuramoyl-L-alanyl-D-glutamate--2,6-diaminopimelate ligase
VRLARPGPRARVRYDPVVSSFPEVSFRHVLAPVPEAELRGEASVGDVCFDSREVTPGALFFCVAGAAVDGHDFAREAVAAGATALVVERWVDLPVAQAKVRSVREAMGPVSALAFGEPATAMTMVGVTGTNGKTTTTYLVESIFRAAGRPCGVIGTTGARIGSVPMPLARTTPEAPDLHRLLALMRDAGVEAVAMEVSSHALDQHRVGGVRFDAVAFTNLSQDHLDYHTSMQAYFDAKASLFRPEMAAHGAVDADDPWGEELLRRATIPMTTFGIDADAVVRARDVQVSVDGASFTVDGRAVRSSLLGRFNVSNCLAALALARVLGLDEDDAVAGIGAVERIPGRVEPIRATGGPLVVVDYAHTPDSIHSVLQAARPLTKGRLIIVFGCGGDRDRAKRPLMGRAATSDADLTVLTSDNPRSEDPLAIITEVEAGAASGGGSYVIEPDRRSAIRVALQQAGPGDTVVIAGKGHETTQEAAGVTVPFDDREVAAEELAAAGDRS